MQEVKFNRISTGKGKLMKTLEHFKCYSKALRKIFSVKISPLAHISCRFHESRLNAWEMHDNSYQITADLWPWTKNVSFARVICVWSFRATSLQSAVESWIKKESHELSKIFCCVCDCRGGIVNSASRGLDYYWEWRLESERKHFFKKCDVSSSEILDFSLQPEGDKNVAEKAEDQMAKQIYALIEHFKQENPVGLPGLLPLPDPTVSYACLKFVCAIIKLFLLSSGCAWHRSKYLNGELEDVKSEAFGDLSVSNQIHHNRNQGHGGEVRDFVWNIDAERRLPDEFIYVKIKRWDLIVLQSLTIQRLRFI